MNGVIFILIGMCLWYFPCYMEKKRTPYEVYSKEISDLGNNNGTQLSVDMLYFSTLAEIAIEKARQDIVPVCVPVIMFIIAAYTSVDYSIGHTIIAVCLMSFFGRYRLESAIKRYALEDFMKYSTVMDGSLLKK